MAILQVLGGLGGLSLAIGEIKTQTTKIGPLVDVVPVILHDVSSTPSSSSCVMLLRLIFSGGVT